MFKPKKTDYNIYFLSLYNNLIFHHKIHKIVLITFQKHKRLHD
ncbi:MAG: hypothetical protein RL619_98 [Bacteroidota bacterium]|jgi:hypothetical protein